jgi:hypothetical protein
MLWVSDRGLDKESLMTDVKNAILSELANDFRGLDLLLGRRLAQPGDDLFGIDP